MPGLADHPLTTGLLASVSRSFYLSLRALPKEVREPLSLAYLLARAADTIADITIRPTGERQALLSQFEQAVAGGDTADCTEAAARFAAGVEHAGEKTLLLRLPECFATLGRTEPRAAALMRKMLGRIIRGQSLDLQRFPGPGAPAALPDAEALEEYTYLVAGCVGEFWTEICALKLPGFAREPVETMVHHGIAYGKGLQLINILRDQARDISEGRCYLPEDELREAGLATLTWPAADWTPWHAVRRHWLSSARSGLQSGRVYVRNLRSLRLRFASLLPLLIGEATLDLLKAQPATETPQPAKVPRAKVKRLLLRALWLSLTGRV